MMKCKHAVELFDSYLKGTANQEEYFALENHLATCEVCKQQFELYRYYFSDVTVENDYPVPSQLNTKIKYAVYQQENNRKKVPFWQNKRILATVTACAFLFVVGILGTSYFSKIKDASGIQNPEATSIAEQDEGTLMAFSPRKTQPTEDAAIPRSVIVVNETNPAVADTQTMEETESLIPAYGGNTVSESRSLMMGITIFDINKNVSPDLSVDAKWMNTILSEFPNEVLTEDTYLVTITAKELEAVIGYSTDADETKTQLTIQFVD